MRPVFILMFCLLYILPAKPLFAEYYHWIDHNGVKHFTDDLSEVPEDQRPGLSIHQSIQSVEKKESTPPEKAGISPESLVSKKKELDIEYQALVKKKETLIQQEETIGEKKYNEIATQLNIEIKQYQEKRKEFEALVNQYNEQIKPKDKN